MCRRVNPGSILFIKRADGSISVCPLRICRADCHRMPADEEAEISFVFMLGSLGDVKVEH